MTLIPFRQDLRTNSDVSAWTVIGDTKYETDWGQQILYTYRSQQYARMYSPKFNSPKEIDISYTISKDSNDNITAEKSWGESLKIFTHDAVISNSNNMISVYHNEVSFGEFIRTEDWLYLSTMDVIYR